MQSQRHTWRAWLHRVVRHEGGASTVEWIALLAIVLVALGLAAFALNENGQIGEGFVAQVECAFETVEIDGEGSDCGHVEDEDDGGCGAWPPWRWFACIAEAFEWLWEEVIQPVVEFVINELTALWKIAEGFIAFLTNPSLEGLLGIIDGACSSLIVSSLPVVGSVCDVKDLIESSMEVDVLGIVLSAVSIFVEGVLSLVGMGAVAGNVMDMITNLIGGTARHGDDVADAGRHGNNTPDGAEGEAPRDNYYDDNPLCDRISYTGRVRGLAAPIDCDKPLSSNNPPNSSNDNDVEMTDAPGPGSDRPRTQPPNKPKRDIKREKADPNNQYKEEVVISTERQSYEDQQKYVDQAKEREKDDFWKKDGTKPATTKTVAVTATEPPSYHHSGYEDIPKSKEKDYDTNHTKEVYDKGQNDKHDFKPSMNDKVGGEKKPGYISASHAEKQALIKALEQDPPAPIAVSKPMCDDCRRFFQTEAKATGEKLTVSDPEGQRIFHPDGSIELHFEDKNGQLQKWQFGKDVDPTYVVPPNASRGDSKPYVPQPKTQPPDDAEDMEIDG